MSKPYPVEFRRDVVAVARKVNSIGRRNTSRWRWFAMGIGKRQQVAPEMRGQMWSPDRPSSAHRDDRVRFWKAIARGVSTEDAAREAGVSGQAGARWFRQGGVGDAPFISGPAYGALSLFL